MKKEVKGLFTKLDGQCVYKIENYDQMENFFMTITSSSDVWNFCWSYGGITCGRIDSNHAIFPYYTADKVSDASSYTGSYACIEAEGKEGKIFWEPFASLCNSPASRVLSEKEIIRSIYKNYNGTQVWFEEKNLALGLTWRLSWTSSARYGIVKSVTIENNGSNPVKLNILDGCRNILPACVTSDFQNSNSILLDAYKKTDVEKNFNLALFSVSSVVSDRAEPNEGLYANISWFTTGDRISVDVDSPSRFISGQELDYPETSKGERASCYIHHKCELESGKSESWKQVFDTSLTVTGIIELEKLISSRKTAAEDLERDIRDTDSLMTEYIRQADGIQDTDEKMTCLHHRQNVMFNIMRGGIIYDDGKIPVEDFKAFVGERNAALGKNLPASIKGLAKESLGYEELEDIVAKEANPQLTRLFYEYMPVTFSRRHGDPSRPWNIFNICLTDKDGKQLLTYQGNWRDIFQNWEALAYSYPRYIKNMSLKFLNAMTAEGFNPYKINRAGLDWEEPDPNNPWAQIGYWGDHQVIYLEKLLELFEKTDSSGLEESLSQKICTSSAVPYRLKSYEAIKENPRNTILFDREQSKALKARAAKEGGDAKLVCDRDGNPYLLSFTSKLLQIVLVKALNLIPGGGIWLNTQRPEWNDANNALAGYGLSVVTLCYLNRYIDMLLKLYSKKSGTAFAMPKVISDCLKETAGLYEGLDEEAIKTVCTSPDKRKEFTDSLGLIFEKERNELYADGYGRGEEEINADEIVSFLKAVKKVVSLTIKLNRRGDGLYHSYNTVRITSTQMEILNLQEMLEGQVAVLSSGILSTEEAIEVIKALENSRMYENRQESYMLYPVKELLPFQKKNIVKDDDVRCLEGFVKRTESRYLERDVNGDWHFNASFRNAGVIRDFIEKQEDLYKPSTKEEEKLFDLYEKTFSHQSFTGRSGTFYAYEGLGSIYWHMVSKLLLAVQENIFKAIDEGNMEGARKLTQSYYKVRNGLSFNKKPELYGAFPQDPYSHTPWQKGARQPGMTGQVKEEILTRWGELGVEIKESKASFRPYILKSSEFSQEGKLTFSWCGTKVTYILDGEKETAITVDGIKRTGCSLTEEETKALFERNGKIKDIELHLSIDMMKL